MDQKGKNGIYISIFSLGVGLYMPLIFFFIYSFDKYLTGFDIHRNGIITLLVINFIIVIGSMSGFLYGLIKFRESIEADKQIIKKIPEELERRSSISKERAELEEFMKKKGTG